MNDDKIRELVKESLLETTADFTHKLMNKVELQNLRKKTRIAFFSAIAACFVLFFLGYQLSALLSSYQLQVSIAPKAVWVVGSLIIFIILHRLMILKDAFSNTQ